MLSVVKHITSSFLPQTASKLDEVLERVHNEVKEEYENCEHKFQKLKEARKGFLKLLEKGHGQEESEDEEEEDMKDKKKMEKTTQKKKTRISP